MIAHLCTGVMVADPLPDCVCDTNRTGVGEDHRTPSHRAAHIRPRDLGEDTADLVALSIEDNQDDTRRIAADEADAMLLQLDDGNHLLESPALTHHHVAQPTVDNQQETG